MKKELTIWGVGLKFTLFSVLYFALALAAHIVWYPLFIIQGIPHVLLVVVGLTLMAIGIPIWIASAKTITSEFEQDVLLIRGVYALCRHPMYGNTIFFTIPGLLLFFRSWLLLTVPVFMYLTFRLLIGKEEDCLREKFGPAYSRYADEVNQVLPRVWKLMDAFFYPLATGRIAENVYTVQDQDVNVFVYTDGRDTIVIDAGYGGDRLRREFEQIPTSPEAVRHLFLTHTDRDHAGGLELFPNAQLYLPQDDVPLIDGTAARLLWFYRNPKITRPYTTIADGDIVTVGDIEVQVIATPGHTPGSTCFLVNDGVLFTGDTLALQNGRSHTFYRPFNMDTETQKKSLYKLAALRNIALLCTAHTGCTEEYEKAMKPWRSQ